jgi:hypothetical protein
MCELSVFPDWDDFIYWGRTLRLRFRDGAEADSVRDALRSLARQIEEIGLPANGAASICGTESVFPLPGGSATVEGLLLPELAILLFRLAANHICLRGLPTEDDSVVAVDPNEIEFN